MQISSMGLEVKGSEHEAVELYCSCQDRAEAIAENAMEDNVRRRSFCYIMVLQCLF